ncbi:hypothetical protein [Devosia sp. RR2S18]|uniref:hypothetical protein n=1 Tax=Devosia rhizosphaerae TaxID=3049774 RepID=UPI002542201F|nr:hypothetical protein [Devosia sp. RR2S18]WIJ26359.1 hypothetical protein QOV41_06245 [Devosia sp. RR2S18]
MTELAAWLQVVIGLATLFIAILQPSRTRRRMRRVTTRWKGFGMEWSRRVEDTDDQA